MPFSMKHLEGLIKVAIENNASDVHIRTDESPCIRIRKDLVPVQTKPFSYNDLVDIAKLLFNNPEMSEQISHITEKDGSLDLQGICRLRYNFFRYNFKIGITIRIIKTTVPDFDSLNLPTTNRRMVEQDRGLILVTGPTGSGKSTTLAAMINEINITRSFHIVTIEDPIEFLHQQKNSRISQREIGTDTADYRMALRSALRQDPDAILIGEIRDSETISAALTASETGHLVFATMHTTNALVTIGRIIAMFPSGEQEEVKKRLADNLYAVVCQRLLKSLHPPGVCIAQEILITNPGIKECIRGDEPLERINSIISKGMGRGGNGSRTFDQHILSLHQKGMITKETAMKAVTSQNDFLQKLLVD